MITPQLLAQGKFSPEDLVVTVSPSNRQTNPHVEAQIEGLWSAKLHNAIAAGKTIYNGMSYRLNNWALVASKLHLDFGVFDFKTRECVIEADGYFDLGEAYFRKGCHTLSTIKTSDDKYLLVELSGKSMNYNAIDFIGGIMETNFAMQTSEDVFSSFYEELEEEACIEHSDIEFWYLALIYLNANTNIGFYFEVVLNIPAESLLQRFKEIGKDQDIKAIRIFDKAAYLRMLASLNINKQFIAKHITI